MFFACTLNATTFFLRPHEIIWIDIRYSNKSYLKSIIMKLSSSMFYGVLYFNIDHIKDLFIELIFRNDILKMVKEK